jgi:very-short-patch-repair endonuclease
VPRKNEAQILLGQHINELKISYGMEYQFDKSRRWRADFYLIEHGILIEIEGSVWTQGRHTRGAGFLADMEKYNTATMLGYRVLRFSTQQVLDGTARAFLKEWLCK